MNIKESRNRINEQIRARTVRVIDSKSEQLGVMDIKEALSIAKEQKLDLVEISPNADPPVTKIMDYGKYLFQLGKKKQKTRQKTVKLKEIKFRPSTDKGDYEVKVRNLRGFLEEGNKVKVTIWFRGREMTHQELGTRLLDRICDDLADVSKVEFRPKLEGRQLVMILAPNKKAPTSTAAQKTDEG